MTKVNTQERTSRETGLEDIMESMYNEDCGQLHASTKRKKKKVKEEEDPKDVVKEADEPMNGYLLDTNTNQLSHLVPASLSAMIQGVQPVQGQAGNVYPLQDSYLIIVLGDSAPPPTDPNAPNPALTDPRSKDAVNWPEKW